jgi:hypothetical protein
LGCSRKNGPWSYLVLGIWWGGNDPDQVVTATFAPETAFPVTTVINLQVSAAAISTAQKFNVWFRFFKRPRYPACPVHVHHDHAAHFNLNQKRVHGHKSALAIRIAAEHRVIDGFHLSSLLGVDKAP